MKKNKPLLIVFLCFLFFVSFSQKWIDGKDLRYLRNQKEILLKFNYSKMNDSLVQAIRTMWEKDLTIKKDALDSLVLRNDSILDKQWTEEWKQKRSNVFEPMFEKNFNTGTANELRANQFAMDAKYTLLVNVLGIYSDYKSGLITCDFQVQIFQSIYPTWPISEAEMLTDPGLNYNGWQVLAIAATIILLPVAIIAGGPLPIFPTPGNKHHSRRKWTYTKFSAGVKNRFAEKGYDLGTEIIENR